MNLYEKVKKLELIEQIPFDVDFLIRLDDIVFDDDDDIYDDFVSHLADHNIIYVGDMATKHRTEILGILEECDFFTCGDYFLTMEEKLEDMGVFLNSFNSKWSHDALPEIKALIKKAAAAKKRELYHNLCCGLFEELYQLQKSINKATVYDDDYRDEVDKFIAQHHNSYATEELYKSIVHEYISSSSEYEQIKSLRN